MHSPEGTGGKYESEPTAPKALGRHMINVYKIQHASSDTRHGTCRMFMLYYEGATFGTGV